MKYCLRLTLVYFLSLGLIKTNAQQKHFIYVESEDRQAFAVVMNGKVYSSSDYGYVIVPKLTDGTYNFTVSFPMNKYPDQNFKCIINKKDVGYKLENNADKGWALQNMQTQKIVAGNSGVIEDNAFSNMLSDVVGDSNLINKNLPAKTFKHDTIATSVNNIIDTVATSASMQVPVTDALNNTSTAIKTSTQPQKISETKLDTGTNMIFVDQAAGDTIHVFVPGDSITANVAKLPQNTTEISSNNPTLADTMSTTLNQTGQNIDTITNTANNPFYKPADVNTPTITSLPGTTSKHETNSAVKQDCSNMISDNDMDKIKRKMFVQSNETNMVQTALHYVNNKCITTEQVKVLGNLFSSDDGRYNLYDVLYKHVYDYGNYASLESQMIDPYYKKRFQVMLR